MNNQHYTFEDKLKNIAVRFLEFFLTPSHIPQLKPEHIKNILVVRQHDQLGDMLCVVPLLRTLKNQFHNSHVTLIASPVNYHIMKHHPFVDVVLNYDKEILRRSWMATHSFLSALRSREYDLAVVPATVSVSVTSDLLALLSGANIRIGAKRLSGKPNQSAFCFTHAVELDWTDEPHRHQTVRNIDVLKLLHLPCDDLSCVIELTEDEQARAKDFLKPFRERYKLFAGFHPGAGKKENQWNAEKFAAVANQLYSEYESLTVITCGPKDEEQVERMVAHLHYPYVVVKQQSIRDVAAIINELDVFVSNDTGIMHVAAGTKMPLLSLFGPTDPLQWAPIGMKNHYIASNDGTIDSISIEQVYSEVQKIISKSTL
ncbi:MAG: glycosyltransferase family 9 protein [Ignavibacteriae bacterium]|nr:glycosyltransferase family 9 protein [Ignavibacteriota bacterium]